MATSSEVDVDPIQTETTRPRSDVRSVSPSFLRALGLIRITSEKTTVTSAPFSKSRVTDTDKNAGGLHTSASKELIRPQKKRSQSKSVATKKAFVVKKPYVSKPKARARKWSHEESFDEPQSIPAVASVEKVGKPAALATRNPNKQQHKASPLATTVSSSAPKSTVMTAENFSKLISAADDKLRFWKDTLDSDFKSMNYTMFLKNCQFTEEQTQAIQRTFQYMSLKFCHRPIRMQPCMKTYACIECNFSISHECLSIDSTKFWNFDGNAPWIDFITPESKYMCQCSFAVVHSHITEPKSGRQARTPEPSPLPSTLPFLENNRSVNFTCSWCSMNISMTNRNKNVCSNLINFISTDSRIRRQFYAYVHKNLDYTPQTSPTIFEFFSCINRCCMLYHRCAKDVVARKVIQPHQPLPCCQLKVQEKSV